MNYIEVEFKMNQVADYFEILQSDLSDIGFESFMDNEDGFMAYCIEDDYSRPKVDEVVEFFLSNNPDVNIIISEKLIPAQNWNEEWEKSYPPVLIDDYCYVHASFHTPMPEVDYNIEITPKMSFGTAHHPTTSQIISLLKDEDLEGKSVMDMGCGTGVLAILAKKKNAAYVEAIDYDEWAYDNAIENVSNNNVEILVRLGDANTLDRLFDVFIANINRNIILRDIGKYSEHIEENGILFLSGFYSKDVEMIEAEAKANGFELVDRRVKEDWTALKLVRK